MDRGLGSKGRARALATVLACALGITLLTAAASAPHRERPHHTLSISLATTETMQVAPRPHGTDAVLADAAISRPGESRLLTAPTTSTPTSCTAATFQARGPPAQAAA